MKKLIQALSVFLLLAVAVVLVTGSQAERGIDLSGMSAAQLDALIEQATAARARLLPAPPGASPGATEAAPAQFAAPSPTPSPSQTPSPSPTPTPKAREAALTHAAASGGPSVIGHLAPLLAAPSQTPVRTPPPHGETRIDQPDLSVKRGQRDDVVTSMQRLLIYYGYLAEGSADGIFGRGTEQAVTRFQEANGLWVTGVIDGETYDALHNGVIEDAAGARDVAFYTPVFTPAPTSKPTPKPTPKPTLKPTAAPAYDEEDAAEMVWIPRSGKRYHDNEYCSNMKNPRYVTIQEAKRRGFTPCKKCY